jgi:hypothetical protein
MNLASKIKDWRTNVTQFVYENFGFEPDEWQKEVFDVFPSQDKDKIRISMQACVGPGKSFVLACCGWNFISCYGDGTDKPKGAALSITGQNLKDNLWAEYAKLHKMSPYLEKYFEQNDDRIFQKQHKKDWFISARTFDKKASAADQGRTLSGLHSKFMMIQIDESGDIPAVIGKVAEQAMVQENAEFRKIMQAGNPTSLHGLLYAAAKRQRHLWHIIRITSDPDDPKRSPRIDIEWAKEQIKIYGRDDPWIKPSILGEFPDQSINSLLSVDEVDAAMQRHYREDSYAFAQKRIGVDVALQGNDETVLFPRQGLVAFQPIAMRTQKPGEISARLGVAKKNWESVREYIDNTGGWGSGVIDHFRMSGYSPVAVEFSGKPTDTGFYNKRSEMWWRMAQWVKRGGALPRVPEMVAELAEPTYTHKNGKLIIEPKDKIKERLGRSPDYADALAMTFWEEDMPGKSDLENIMEKYKSSIGSTKLKDYNPYDPDRY